MLYLLRDLIEDYWIQGLIVAVIILVVLLSAFRHRQLVNTPGVQVIYGPNGISYIMPPKEAE